MKPLAIIPAYNEADIVGPVIRHLQAQDCEVHVIDNWSTDDTLAIAFAAGASIETWPEARPVDGAHRAAGSVVRDPNNLYDWTGILKRVETIAFERGRGRWCMLNDADEIRRPSTSETLAQALASAGDAGFNAVPFDVRHFVPIDNTFIPGSDPEAHFRYYKTDHVDAKLSHIKAWKQGDTRVDLHSTGGHEAQFYGRRVLPAAQAQVRCAAGKQKECPAPFLLKHYPIRSEEQGRRKIFQERLPRYMPAELAMQWHVQYNDYRDGRQILGDPRELRRDHREVTIVTLTRFPEIFHRFAASVEAHEPHRRKIVVTSGGCQIDPRWIKSAQGREAGSVVRGSNPNGWQVIEGIEPFIFARNLNLAIAAAPGDDIFACNDDVEFVGPLVAELQSVFDSGRHGLITPQIIGDGINNELAAASTDLGRRYLQSSAYVPFVSVLLNRDMLRAVGPVKEFDGYGGDDVEFGNRMHRAGWASFVSGCTAVKHGFGGHRYSSSFHRVMSPQQRERSMAEMNSLISEVSARP